MFTNVTNMNNLLKAPVLNNIFDNAKNLLQIGLIYLKGISECGKVLIYGNGTNEKKELYSTLLKLGRSPFPN